MPGLTGECVLTHNTDDPAGSWGSFYLNPSDCKPGYYDFVFTYEGKAFATMLTRFYGESELESKTDPELDALAK